MLVAEDDEDGIFPFTTPPLVASVDVVALLVDTGVKDVERVVVDGSGGDGV